MKDDVEDENSIKAKMLMLLIKGAFEKARDEYPEKEAAVRTHLEELLNSKRTSVRI